MTFAPRRFDNRLERFRALLLALTMTPLVIVAQAQQTSTTDKTQSTSAKPAQEPQKSPEGRRIQAVRVADAIKIDGLLDEPDWSLAQPATEFLQQQPTEGAPASERTEVRVLFDDKNIYLGIRAFDSGAASRRQGTARVPVLRLRRPRSVENRSGSGLAQERAAAAEVGPPRHLYSKQGNGPSQGDG